MIHEMTLCRFQEMIRKITVEDRYQPQIGGLKNVKKPFGIAKSN